MADRTPDVTLATLHGDLADLRGDVGGVRSDIGDLRGDVGGLRGDVADLKATVVAGFARMPTREQSDEMIRLLREGNRLQEERFAQLDATLRAQHLETHQVLHALVDSHRNLIDSHRDLADSHRDLADSHRGLADAQRGLSSDIKALIARIDAIIRGRNNGNPGA